MKNIKTKTTKNKLEILFINNYNKHKNIVKSFDNRFIVTKYQKRLNRIVKSN